MNVIEVVITDNPPLQLKPLQVLVVQEVIYLVPTDRYYGTVHSVFSSSEKRSLITH